MPDPPLFADAPLLSAELPYYRIPRDDWELMLARARQIGANTVACYVPWAWHEPRPGELDLDGRTEPRRDLAGFLRLCALLGLRALLKPGPFASAELLGGIPPWLLYAHPEIHALRPDGQPWRHSDSGLPRPCSLHPTYLAAARRWIAAFSEAALPFQAPAGPVVAVQVDNEIPGEGVLPSNTGLDPRLRLDYNPYVADELWPRWLREHESAAAGAARRQRTVAAPPAPGTPPAPPPALPRSFNPPTALADLDRYVKLNAFTDWYHAEALATAAGWLRQAGWRVPLFHNLLAAPWEASGTIADAPGMARAVGWLGYSVSAGAMRAPFGGAAGRGLSFEEYVHCAHWRSRLTRSLSPGYPAFVPEIDAAQDFLFAAPLLGGAQAISLSALAQSVPDNPGAAAFPRWAMGAPVRPDGGVRPRFWNAKTIFGLLGAAGGEFATAAQPADVAIGYSHVPENAGAWGYRPDYPRRGRAWEPSQPELAAAMGGADHATRGQLLAQRLVSAGVAFDVLDLGSATTEQLASYRLLLVPACGIMHRDIQAKLAGAANLALVGDARTLLDERLARCSVLEEAAPARLPADVAAQQIADLVEERGGFACYAWADAPDVDVAVRHGEHRTWLFVANRRASPYSGTIAYRSSGGEVLHLQLSMGGLRVAAVLLSGDEVLGVAAGGDASDGGWLARGLSSSIVFSGGAGAVAPCGDGLALTAPQSGRFQLRRAEGWEDVSAHRLLLSGELLPAPLQIDARHVSVPYIAEDDRGTTDCVLVLPARQAPPGLRAYLATLLLARAAMMRRLERPELGAAADALAALAAAAFDLDEYAAAWEASAEACSAVARELTRELARARGEHAAGITGEPGYAARERTLGWTVGLLARASLAGERE